MGRNYADALCQKCGESFLWLIGTLRVCGRCQAVANYLDSGGKDKEAERALAQLLENGNPRQKCVAFCLLDAAATPLEEATDRKLQEFEKSQANLVMLEKFFDEVTETLKKFRG